MQLILYQPIQLFSYFEKTDYYGYVRGPASPFSITSYLMVSPLLNTLNRKVKEII